MDASRRLWPRSDLRVGDADRQSVVSELQRHFVEGRLTSEELGERVSQALAARTFGDLATLLSDLPALEDTSSIQTVTRPRREDWPASPASSFNPAFGMLLVLIGVLAILAVFVLPLGHIGFFPWPLLIWGFFFFGRPHRGRRF